MSEREHLLPHHGQEEEDLTFMSSFKHTLYSSKINWLLVFVPIAIIFSGASDTVVFSLNFIAIIPLAKLLGFGKSNFWIANVFCTNTLQLPRKLHLDLVLLLAL